MEPFDLCRAVGADRCLEHLDALIRLPSVTGSEGKVGTYLAGTLEAAGARVATPEVAPGRFNVIATWEGDGAGPTLLLAGHMDTVPPVAGWSRDPYVPYREGDRVYGLGACDMKAGLAAILSALEAVSAQGGPRRGTLAVALVVDEEAYSEGMKSALASGLHADMAIMAEPHFREAVCAAPGKVLVAGTVSGRAAHGATPEAGVNAIFEACRFLARVEELEGMRHRLLGSHRYCVLGMHGGQEQYCIVVPDECRFTLNKHLVPGETGDMVLEQLHSLARQMDMRAGLRLELRPPYYAPYCGDTGGSPFREIADACARVTGHDLRFGVTSGASDANLLWGAGIPTVSFGPSGGGLHSADEWASVTELQLAAQVYAWVIARVCGVRSGGR